LAVFLLDILLAAVVEVACLQMLLPVAPVVLAAADMAEMCMVLKLKHMGMMEMLILVAVAVEHQTFTHLKITD
jgi:hypothetical protein